MEGFGQGVGRRLLYLLVLGVAVFILLPHVIGFERTLRVVRTAQPFFVALALGCEISRYFLSAASTYVLARLFDRRVPFFPLLQAFFAGAALNRTFSTGGAPGMVVRALFLSKQGVHLGSVATLFLIEDINGIVVGGIALLIGIVTLARARVRGAFAADLAVIGALGAFLLLLGALYLYRRRALVEKIAHTTARGISAAAQRVLGRAFYEPARIERGVDDFYAGGAAARRRPLYAALSLLLNALRYLAGAASLYFSFYALGWTISPATVILFSTATSMVSTLSAAPGEAAIMGGGIALLSHAFALPRHVAAIALLLARAIAFWLPLPLGYLALWNLRRGRFL